MFTIDGVHREDLDRLLADPAIGMVVPAPPPAGLAERAEPAAAADQPPVTALWSAVEVVTKGDPAFAAGPGSRGTR